MGIDYGGEKNKDINPIEVSTFWWRKWKLHQKIGGEVSIVA